MRSIALPLAAPGLTTAGLFAFLPAWDEFFHALLLTADQRGKTLTIAIADLTVGCIVDHGLIAAARHSCRIAAGDRRIWIAEGLLISGLTTGGVKE